MALLLTTPRSSVATRPVWRDMTPRARDIGSTLQAPASATHGRFDLRDVVLLPEPAQRWLAHAITPGTRLAAAAELQMHGAIRLGKWRRFTATQVLVPDAGYVWAARTSIGRVPVRGFDSYTDGYGRLCWRALGALRLMSGTGFDVTLSAAHRLAAESVLIPPSLVHARWVASQEPDSATFEHGFADHDGLTHITVTVDVDGALRRVSLQRWGNPLGGRYGLHGFEVEFDSEFAVDGIRIGDGMRAAWIDHAGRRDEFYRASIDSAQLFVPRLVSGS